MYSTFIVITLLVPGIVWLLVTIRQKGTIGITPLHLSPVIAALIIYSNDRLFLSGKDEIEVATKAAIKKGAPLLCEEGQGVFGGDNRTYILDTYTLKEGSVVSLWKEGGERREFDLSSCAPLLSTTTNNQE